MIGGITKASASGAKGQSRTGCGWGVGIRARTPYPYLSDKSVVVSYQRSAPFDAAGLQHSRPRARSASGSSDDLDQAGPHGCWAVGKELTRREPGAGKEETLCFRPSRSPGAPSCKRRTALLQAIAHARSPGSLAPTHLQCVLSGVGPVGPDRTTRFRSTTNSWSNVITSSWPLTTKVAIGFCGRSRGAPSTSVLSIS